MDLSTRVYFGKLHPAARIPTKRVEDAGYDLYSVLNHAVCLSPGETRLIPTGICSSFSSDYVAVVKERGSTGSKGLGVRAGIIDSGYRGEWFVALTNHNSKPLVIAPDDLPDPERPVITTSESRGMDRSTFLRLWTLAPIISICFFCMTRLQQSRQ